MDRMGIKQGLRWWARPDSNRWPPRCEHVFKGFRGASRAGLLGFCAVSVAGIGAMGTHGHTVSAVSRPAEPITWESPVRADGGVPVEWDGGTLYLYGDTVTEDRFYNSSVVLDDGTVLYDVLPAAPNDGWFWLMDAREVDDALFVLASELQRDDTSWFGFRVVDTDAFMVNDPTNAMSWRLSKHIDAGWWDGLNVRFFGDGWALARPHGQHRTWLVSPSGAMGERFDDIPDSDGVFAPVRFDGYLWGLTWDMASGEVEAWRTDRWDFPHSYLGEWEPLLHWEYAPEATYGHSLAVIDGRLVHYWSTVGGRVTYEALPAP